MVKQITGNQNYLPSQFCLIKPSSPRNPAETSLGRRRDDDNDGGAAVLVVVHLLMTFASHFGWRVCDAFTEYANWIV